jgi:2-C-methyl-D-erythritol 4-phosphate cytidylyltransferase
VRYWVVIPAAGSGQRFGGALPKQYAVLEGRPLLRWALDPFLDDTLCRGLVVALSAGDRQWSAVAAALPSGRVQTVAGGAERCDSVLQGLKALPAAPEDWVLVHDAARPCLSRAEVTALLQAVADHPDGGLLALPLADTLKQADADGGVGGTVPREGLWRALTPQMFRHGRLTEALHAARAAGVTPTDESQALERLGARPHLVVGDALNIKVTTQADLAFAAAVLRSRGGTG